MGRYRGSSEELDTADTLREAKYLRTEYAIAFGACWAVWIEDENGTEVNE